MTNNMLYRHDVCQACSFGNCVPRRCSGGSMSRRRSQSGLLHSETKLKNGKRSSSGLMSLEIENWTLDILLVVPLPSALCPLSSGLCHLSSPPETALPAANNRSGQSSHSNSGFRFPVSAFSFGEASPRRADASRLMFLHLPPYTLHFTLFFSPATSLSTARNFSAVLSHENLPACSLRFLTSCGARPSARALRSASRSPSSDFGSK